MGLSININVCKGIRKRNVSQGLQSDNIKLRQLTLLFSVPIFYYSFYFHYYYNYTYTFFMWVLGKKKNSSQIERK